MTFVILSLFVLLIVDSASFIRDLLDLPLYNDIFYFIQILLFVFLLSSSLFICKLNNVKKIFFIPIESLQFLIFSSLIFSLNLLKIYPNFLLSSQLIQFSLALFFIKNFLKVNKINLFFQLVNLVLLFYLFFLLILHAIAIFFDLEFADYLQRNSLPIIALLTYLLAEYYDLKKQAKFSLFLCIILSVICRTKITLVVLPLFLIINFFLKLKQINSQVRSFICSLMFFFLCILPYILPSLFTIIFNLTPSQLQILDSTRYYLNDNLVSLLSRIYSVEFVLNNLKLLSFSGIEFSELVKFKVLGYIPHNLFLSAVINNGFFGGFAIFLLLKIFYRVSKINFLIGILGIICINYFNDFYSWFALFLIPVLIPKNRDSIL